MTKWQHWWAMEEQLPHLDSCKAFDMAWHHILTSKLQRNGFEDRWNHGIRSWLNCWSQQVAVNSSKLRWRPDTCGGPQESNLSLALFNTFIYNTGSGTYLYTYIYLHTLSCC